MIENQKWKEKLEAALKELPPLEPPPELLHRILDIPRNQPHTVRIHVAQWLPQNLTVLKYAAAFLLVVGLFAYLCFRLGSLERTVTQLAQSQALRPDTAKWILLGNQIGRDKILDHNWRRAAVIVGVGEYLNKEIPGLKTSVSRVGDAEDWAVRQFGAVPANVLKLMNPTEITFKSSLLYLRQFNRASDTIVIYFLGHAIHGSTGELEFQLHDSKIDSGVRASEVFRLLGDTKSRILIIVDTCYAGLLSRSSWDYERISIVMSAGPEQRAIEMPSLEEAGSSSFSELWFKSLRGPAADQNDDGVITLAEALEWTTARMREESYPYTPSVAPGSEEDLILSLHPSLLDDARAYRGDLLPPPGIVTLQLMEKPTAADHYELQLDGINLGTFFGPEAILHLSEGTHKAEITDRVLMVPEGQWRFEVIGSPVQWVETDTAERKWKRSFKIRAGKRERIHVKLVSVEGVTAVRVFGADSPFSEVVLSPSDDCVKTEITDGVVYFSFYWKGDHAKSASASYVVSGHRGVNVAEILDFKSPEDEAVVSFEARADRSVTATFAVGGEGDDSLKPRASVKRDLYTDRWIRFRIPVSEPNRMYNLVNGFGVEVKREDMKGQSIQIMVRDVIIEPKGSEE